MVSNSQHTKSLHKILASKLTLSIPSSSSSPPTEDFDFSDVFGPTPSQSSSSSSSQPTYPRDPPVIHYRTHSFLGPSPRYTPPNFHPFQKTPEEIISQITDDDDEIEVKRDEKDGTFIEQLVCIEEERENGMVPKVGPEDFEILRLVGKGAFGKVFQVRKKGDCDDGGDGIMAMKVMRKDNIIKKNHVDYMIAERDILTKVVHPFIVQLRYSFQTKSKLYLILDFLNGGHLFFHLYRQGIFSEDQARLYTAEIVSAVSHLHKNGIVHRDLKPENILMDADGHIVLTDFGLAKEIDETSRTNSMCGTMEYMAPEIIQAKGHNKNADWWSIGILLYEMLSGKPPFAHANRQKLQQKIINDKVKLPSMVSTEAHSLLRGLLQKDPSKRLGSGPAGSDEVKSHRWFRPINWKKLEAKELKPKFKPDVNGKECTANFDKCWTTMPADDSPASTPTGNEHFAGYTYVAPNP
ncbi:serine/threonine-protein kinase AtPK1/AtPK6-like [Chenopodium quinoa]|uniref:non-specific serine/threonine protein kinase n=1 Tax=Chenopodium quinoa TaxID=63459 RepID=A0A803L8X1_CHEQI|nr:serine/threonine-protein kinase AtPK1/AtPK6-like [Chenopodium quinoa]